MKLIDLFEANPWKVQQTDPSGVGVPTSVDPDNLSPRLRTKVNNGKTPDRSKLLRKRLSVTKGLRSGPKPSTQTVGDNEDLTGSGVNSAVNGPFDYPR